MSKLFGYRNSSPLLFKSRNPWKLNITTPKTPWSSVREEWLDEQGRLAKAWDRFENKLRQVDNELKGYRLYKRCFSASSNNSKLNFNNSNNEFPP
jgi:hypothetical protein